MRVRWVQNGTLGNIEKSSDVFAIKRPIASLRCREGFATATAVGGSTPGFFGAGGVPSLENGGSATATANSSALFGGPASALATGGTGASGGGYHNAPGAGGGGGAATAIANAANGSHAFATTTGGNGGIGYAALSGGTGGNGGIACGARDRGGCKAGLENIRATPIAACRRCNCVCGTVTPLRLPRPYPPHGG